VPVLKAAVAGHDPQIVLARSISQRSFSYTRYCLNEVEKCHTHNRLLTPVTELSCRCLPLSIEQNFPLPERFDDFLGEQFQVGFRIVASGRDQHVVHPSLGQPFEVLPEPLDAGPVALVDVLWLCGRVIG